MLDSLSGFFQNNGGSFFGQNLSAIIRIGVFLALVSFAVLLGRKRDFTVLFLTSALVLFALWVQVLWSTMEDLAYSAQVTIKVLLPLFLIPVVSIQVKERILTRKSLALLVVVNSTCLIANVLLGYFSIGFDNYGATLSGEFKGGRGFFYAGNEVAGTLLALLALNVLLFFRSMTLMLIIFASFFSAAIGLLSKAALAGCVVIFIIYIFVATKRHALAMSLVAIVVTGAFYTSIINALQFGIGRWAFQSEKYGFITMILGGEKRLQNASRIITEIIENPFSLLFGLRWSGEAENNLVDLIEGYGLLGFALVLFWLFRAITAATKNMAHDKRVGWISLVSMLMLLSVSVFAGHILQSAMISIFIVILSSSDVLALLSEKKYSHYVPR